MRNHARPLLALLAWAVLSGLSARATVPPVRGTVVCTLQVGALNRTYDLHVPARLPTDQPAPLVLVFHGGGGTAAQVERATKFSELADRAGFLVAYPEGVGKGWNDGRGSTEIAAHRGNVDDLGFVAALIDDIAKDRPLDRKRVFATGISNGAIFSHYLAANQAARIAAIAPVVGGLSEPAGARFAPTEPVSVLILQGTEDKLVPYAGGNIAPPLIGKAGKRGRVIATDETVKKWVAANGCRPEPVRADLVDADPKDGCRATRFTYAGGRNGAAVVLCRIEGGGHTWPGGAEPLPHWLVGNVCRDFNATAMIWEFFQTHAKP